MDRIDWAENALCAEVDPEIFFPVTGQRDDGRKAKRICAKCHVVDKCLEYGMNVEFGIYGGLTASERARLRRTRNGEAA
jgi:WhiB family redox-sensing transcriptional regulator